MTYPMFGKHWRCRWLVLPSWNRLHRVAEITWFIWFDLDLFAGVGRTACGRVGVLAIPGVISRIGLQRCAHCCRMTGTPNGYGNPYNEKARVNERGGLIFEARQ